MIPAFVCKEYPYSKACVDEFKYARMAGKLLVIALAPVCELRELEFDEAVGNGPVIGHFKRGEQCLRAWPGAPPGDADGTDFSQPEAIAEYISRRHMSGTRKVDGRWGVLRAAEKTVGLLHDHTSSKGSPSLTCL